MQTHITAQAQTQKQRGEKLPQEYDFNVWNFITLTSQSNS